MMMMNFLMSRRRTTRTTTCYALLSILLVASLALVVPSVNAKNGMANTMPEDNKVISRVLTGENEKPIFTRIYFAVTKAADFMRLFPNGGDTPTFLDNSLGIGKINPLFSLQGSSTTQKGAIFDFSSIEVVNAPDGVEVTIDVGIDVQVQFEGNRKIRFTPVDDPYYFFHGQCVVTSGIFEPLSRILSVADPTYGEISIPQPVITSQLCKLNLCLGGGGFSCIAIYSGSAFVFNFGKGIAINNAAPRDIFNSPLTFEAPPLPPPFPGTIIGGKG